MTIRKLYSLLSTTNKLSLSCNFQLHDAFVTNPIDKAIFYNMTELEPVRHISHADCPAKA